MIDQNFLDTFDIKSEDIQKIQDDIMVSVKNKDFTQLNDKYDPDVIRHLCHDLVTQGKLFNVLKPTMEGIEYLFDVSDNLGK